MSRGRAFGVLIPLLVLSPALGLAAGPAEDLAVQTPEGGDALASPGAAAEVEAEDAAIADTEGTPADTEAGQSTDESAQPTEGGDAAPAPADAEAATVPTEGGGLLAPSKDEPEATPRPKAPSADDPSAQTNNDEALRLYYKQLYRPASNPARPWFTARASFLQGSSGDDSASGRHAVFTVGAGATWNFIGAAAEADVFVGQFIHGGDRDEVTQLLVGGGPMLSIGRLGLVRHGYLDVRAGYQFFWGQTSARVAGDPDPSDIAPHGARLRIDAGFMLRQKKKTRFRHAIGLGIGWRIFVGSFGGDFPVTNMFDVGLGYWFG